MDEAVRRRSTILGHGERHAESDFWSEGGMPVHAPKTLPCLQLSRQPAAAANSSTGTAELRKAQAYAPNPKLDDPELAKNLAESAKSEAKKPQTSNTESSTEEEIDESSSQANLYAPNSGAKVHSKPAKENYNSQLQLYSPEAALQLNDQDGQSEGKDEKHMGAPNERKTDKRSRPKRNLGGAEVDPNLLLEGEGTRSRL